MRALQERLERLESLGGKATQANTLSPERRGRLKQMIGDMQRLNNEQWRTKYAQELAGPRYPIARTIPGYPATTRFLRELAISLGDEPGGDNG